jgi:hypothetical protein
MAVALTNRFCSSDYPKYKTEATLEAKKESLKHASYNTTMSQQNLSHSANVHNSK